MDLRYKIVLLKEHYPSGVYMTVKFISIFSVNDVQLYMHLIVCLSQGALVANYPWDGTEDKKWALIPFELL